MSAVDRLAVATWLVEQRGFSVIPLEPRGKRPVAKWAAFQEARPSRTNLEAWFRVDGSRNLGIVTGAISNIVAVDCDSPAAIAWATTHLPATEMRTITPRGQHWYYRHPGSAVSNAAHVRTDEAALALDVRGDGGYVVAPSSVHESGAVYTRAGSWPPVAALPVFDPAWIRPEAPPSPPPPPPGPERDADRAELLARVREYLLHVPPAIQGQGGDDHTYRLCAKLVRGFALSDDEAFELLQPWNARCQPKWPDAELREKLHNARLYGEEPFGGRRDAPPPGTAAPPLERTWPAPLGDIAYIGVLGQIVQVLKLQTESDPVALLLQMLVMLGNIIGRTAHFIVESKKHFLNEFVLLVGDTSKSRKGTSYEYAEQLFLPCDPLWTRVSGLSSGEGLIWSVRDPIVSSGKKGQVTTDPGITDKRLLVFESELASTLHVMERSGNTLGDVMKNAWDGRALGTMTKHEPARATGAHVSVVAHITNAELHRYLTRTEIANGWANRFLVLCVKRARLLPLGGQQVALGAFQAELAHVVRVAKATSVMPFEAEAERHWCAKYEWLSVDRPGLLGSMAARAEAHTRRLACLYALSDGCQEVRLPHLEAALECWRYAFDSLAYVFGDALGDTEADTILRALRQAPDGLTRTELHKLFGSHLSTTDLDRALGLLVRLHLIVKVEADREGTGRPAERWRAVRQDC